ncbi:hypothetical protein DCAR_0417458 [Daucus carota subsp. sativus]|uniref:Protein kinase domain-containing protein n=2 Tax=Daucus carota subsp. sativus TaxID=79200 RepID=A0AAF1AYT4_DAUCS|nr:hypothetical protein DCAR_0417458 [Daucus carota subsp. sativus]
MHNAAFLFVTFFLHYSTHLTHSLNSDGLSLLALKSAITTDPTHSLTFWSETDTTPCHWEGITCDNVTQRVSSVSLSNKNFTGYIPSELGTILSLQSLSLSNNNFSKLIPLHLFNATNLVSLDLSHNSLSGPIPDKITSLQYLKHLDLSCNDLSGSLPESLSELTHLSGTVNLSYNRFSGEVPASYGKFPVFLSLDFRQNNLTGKIPQEGSLLNQGPTAFSGNPGLCGFPLQVLCTEPEAQNPRVVSDPENPKPLNGFTGRAREKNGSVAVPLISAVAVVIGVVFVSVWVIKKKWKVNEGKTGKEKLEKEVNSEEGQKGKFIVLDEGFNLELEDLLRASAYVVGKSRSGIVYKVVVGRGSGAAGAVVAVRRLSEGDNTWKFKEFDSEMEAIGRVQHQNIVRLRAYYYAHDEKLVVSDYISNGSLYTALHGGPANTLPPFSWAIRLKIAQGTARALAHIHEYSPRKYVHGNIKLSKILLDDDLQPYISGFGLSRLVSGGISKSTNGGFKKQDLNQTIVSPKNSASTSVYHIAPEARVSTSRFTQRSDVYSFGIVLLEILTGRSPDGGADNNGMSLESVVRKVFREERPLSEIIDPALKHEVHAKAQVVAAFHVAISCTELDPELRPKMRMVSDCLDRIKA